MRQAQQTGAIVLTSAHAAGRRGGGVVELSLDEANPAAQCSYDDLLIIDQALSLWIKRIREQQRLLSYAFSVALRKVK